MNLMRRDSAVVTKHEPANEDAIEPPCGVMRQYCGLVCGGEERIVEPTGAKGACRLGGAEAAGGRVEARRAVARGRRRGRAERRSK